jgi:acyl carrier protein
MQEEGLKRGLLKGDLSVLHFRRKYEVTSEIQSVESGLVGVDNDVIIKVSEINSREALTVAVIQLLGKTGVVIDSSVIESFTHTSSGHSSDINISELGLTSVSIVHFCQILAEELSVQISPVQLYEFTTLTKLVSFILTNEVFSHIVVGEQLQVSPEFSHTEVESTVVSKNDQINYADNGIALAFIYQISGLFIMIWLLVATFTPMFWLLSRIYLSYNFSHEYRFRLSG